MYSYLTAILLLSLNAFAQNPIRQGAMECGPASVFNAFLFGGAPLRDAINAIPGQTEAEKYGYVVNTLAAKPSSYYNSKRPRLSENFGMHVSDIHALALDILNEPDLFDVSDGSPEIGESPSQFTERMFRYFERSILRQVPVVILISAYESGKELNIGHAVTVTKVERRADGINLKIVDPLFAIDHIDFLATVEPDLGLRHKNKGVMIRSDGRVFETVQTWKLSFMMGDLK
jgi:hypothetical protein